VADLEWLYQPNYGVINDLLIRAGWMHERLAWLSWPDTAMARSSSPMSGAESRSFAIMLLAGLQAVPDVFTKQPRRWRRHAGPFWHITWRALPSSGRDGHPDHLDIQLCRPDLCDDRRRPRQCTQIT